MKKVVLFAFNGELMCFVHVLLNGLDMHEKGFEVKIVIEGSATKLVPDLGVEGNLLSAPFKRVQSLGLIEGVCKACATKMGTVEDAASLVLPLLSNMWGHPGMAKYIQDGYQIVTF